MVLTASAPMLAVKAFAILVLRLEQFIFGEELELLERGQPGW